MNGEEILKEMNGFVKNEVQAVPEQSSEDEVLPFESLDDYSTDPIGFEEIADMVCSKVKYFFSLSVKYNHRSTEYLEVCGILERGIKYLGSCCLTKVLLKKKGHDLPKLEDLSTHWLYGMVSFNIRKLNRTVDEDLSCSGAIPSKWLDMQFRYINLAERLKSTETKIYELTNYYWLDSDKYVKRALMFSEKAYNRADVKKHIRKPDFRLAPSFPAVKEFSDISGRKPSAESRKSETDTQHTLISTQLPAAEESSADRSGSFSAQLSACSAEETISHAEEPVPAFMAILERAAERSKDDEEGGFCFTFEELDALAFDPQFREFDPGLAEMLRKKHAEMFPGTGSP